MTLDPNGSPLIKALLKSRKQLQSRNKDTVNGVISTYMKGLKRLQSKIDDLANVIPIDVAITEAALLEITQFRSLMLSLRSEIKAFTTYMADVLDETILAEIEAALADTFILTSAALPLLDTVVVQGMWAQIVPQQVFNAYAFLRDDGVLYANLLDNMGPVAVQSFVDIFLANFVAGMNPNEIAALIAISLQMPLSWAVMTVRTAQLWSYRLASHQNYLNNGGIVKGWIWWCALDIRTCMSCVNMHGTFLPLNEILDDHHSGRCSPVPQTKTYAELGFEGLPEETFNVFTGEQWFKGLNQTTQIRMMGPGMHAAWADGAFEFSSLTRKYNNNVYGAMRREASLKSILGDKAALYYV